MDRNFTVKVFEKGKLLAKCQSHSIRRAVDRLQRANFREPTTKVYIRVSYGDGFYNSGTYFTRKDLNSAWRAFIEI